MGIVADSRFTDVDRWLNRHLDELNGLAKNESLQICIQNMEDMTNQILPLALELQAMSFGQEMEPIINELSTLGKALSNGVDVNKNGIVEPPAEQCGAFQAYDYGTNMADFPIFIGPDRLPPTPVSTSENN